MKKFLILLPFLFGASFSEACSCSGGGAEICEVAPFLLMATITSAPSGTTMLSGIGCREEVLAVQQEAVNYKITGETSALLSAVVDVMLTSNSRQTEEDVINKLINIQVK